MSSLLTLYSLDSGTPIKEQEEYLFEHLRGKFFDISEIESQIQLVPISVDADIVSEVLQRHPAAAFKTKIGNPKQLDIIYDANDKYYLQY